MMQDASVNYRNPATPLPRCSVLPLLIIATCALLLAISILLCITTWNTPGRFIFLPGGDVGLGFRSYGGWLDWVEYAPWDRNPDYIRWSLPWAAVFFAQGLTAVLAIYVRRRRTIAY